MKTPEPKKKLHAYREPRPRTLSLHPSKAEEALAAFMRADPKKLAEKMRRLRRKREF